MTNADSQPPSSIITMWTLLEGNKRATQIDLDKKNYKPHNLNLDQFTLVLQEKFAQLRNVELTNVEFLSFDEHNTLTLLPVDASLTSITTTALKPLVVRYRISDDCIKYRFLRNSESFRIPHSSGSWVLIREAVQNRFNNLRNCDFYFVAKVNSAEEEIINDFQFKSLVARTDSNSQGERFLDLKIQIKGKKAYGDWTFKEVSNELYNNAFNSIDSMPIFEIEEIFKIDPPLNDDDLKRFEYNLREKMRIFHNEVTINGATTREFISVFLSLAVGHVRTYNDLSTRLKVEVDLDGSRGYGVLDYGVYVQQIPVLVTEAKPHESEKAVAQTLVQLHSAAESLLGKRKRSEQTMFGIMTTGRSWRFIRWNGTLESPKVEITKEQICIFEDDMKEAKKMVSYIVRVLQAQAKSLSKEEQRTKRQCIAE
ncbi:25265_t:CDS:2 [Gigaspora rosea]|nr:25265_t:CDS:2 [Gigaspora rosea]